MHHLDSTWTEPQARRSPFRPALAALGLSIALVLSTLGSPLEAQAGNLGDGGTISGVVTAQDGTPLAQVNVNALLENGTTWSLQGNVDTAADGSYRITGLIDGTYRLFFYDRSQTHAFEYWDGAPDLDGATDIVISGGATVVVDNPMELAARITGSLTDPGGRPLEAALVFAFEAGPTRGNALMAASAESGSYDLGGLPTGDYVIQFTGRQGLRSYVEYFDSASLFADASTLSIIQGQTTASIDGVLGLGPGGILSGTLSDPYGRPFDDARVDAYRFVDGAWVLATGTDLPYRETAFDLDVEAGTYRLHFSGTRFPVPASAVTEVWNDVDDLASGLDVTVGIDERVRGIDAVLGDRSNLSLSGTVTDSSGAAIEGVEVILYNSRLLPLFDQIAVTDASGGYSVSDLWPDGYRVRFYDPQGRFEEAYFDAAGGLADAAEILLESDVTAIDATLSSAPVDGPGSISGTVLLGDDAAGGGGDLPLFGARISATTLTGDSVATAFSATDGSYRLRNLPAGSYLVRFSAPGGEAIAQTYDDAVNDTSATAVSVASNADTGGIDATLDPAGAISGTVSDAFGNAFSLLTVTAYALVDGVWEPVGSTSELNATSYRLGPLPVGTYRVAFSGGSWTGPRETEVYQGVDSLDLGTDVPVLAGETTGGIDAILGSGPPGEISGTVTDDAGQPVEGIEVSVFDSSLTLEPRSATTDASGSYSIDLLYPDTYYLRFTDPTAMLPEEFFDDAPSLELATPVVVADSAISGIDAVLDGPGSGPGGAAFAGVVTDADSGAPISGVRVSCQAVEDIAFPSCFAITDTSGAFQLGGNLPAASYTLRFSMPDGSYGTRYYDDADFFDQATPVSGVPGQALSGLDSTLEPAGAISGTVTDPFGNDFALLFVTAYRFDDGHWKAFASTAEINSSAYTLNALPAGTYRIGFVARRSFSGAGSGTESEFWADAATVEMADDITVTAGQTTTNIDAVLGTAPPGAISGTVTDSAGTPLQGIEVTLYDGDRLAPRQRVSSDSGGAYRFAPLFDGVYYVGFSDPDGLQPAEYWQDIASLDQATPITIDGAPVSAIDAALDGGGSGPGGGAIAGRVTDIGGTGLGGIQVRCEAADPSTFDLAIPPCSTTTAADGSYQLGGNLPAGDYLVSFRSGDQQYGDEYYRNAISRIGATAVEVSLGAVTSDIDEDLLAAGAVAGTVTNLNGGSFSLLIASAFVLQDGQWVPRGETFELGNTEYLLGGLPAGTYRVAFSGGSWTGPRQQEVWNNAETLAAGDDITVIANAVTTGIDAVLGTLDDLNNGDFDSSLAHWVVEADALSEVAYSSEDAAGLGTSGSARMDILAPGSAGPRLHQCVGAEPGVRYRLWNRSRLSGANAEALTRITFFAGEACDGEALLTLDAGGQSAASADWRDGTVPLLHAPQGTLSARVELSLAAPDVASAHFDNLTLRPVEALHLSPFENGPGDWDRVEGALAP
ncbi:MAG: carboxypeptidase-like regulatory domain-containing protein [Acidobacteriota bacterium]